MKNLEGFFEKHNSKITQHIRNFLIILDSIKRHAKIDLDEKSLSIKSGILYIKASSLVKNEIFIKKEKILKEINSKLDSIRISDIK